METSHQPTSRGLPQPIRGLLVNQASAHKESDTLCGFTGQNPVDKDFKVPNLAGVRASINRRCLALRAQPALGSCSCLAVLYQSVAAHVTRRPVPISHRNWLYRISSSFLTTGLGLSGVNFDDQAVGTNSKTRSRHRPRLSWESASIYPHEMSLKPRN